MELVCSHLIIPSELQLPEPFSFIFTWLAAVPLLLWLSTSITKLIVKDFLILKVTFTEFSSLAIWLIVNSCIKKFFWLWLPIFTYARALAQTVEPRTFPSLGLFFRFLVEAPQTKWNAPSELWCILLQSWMSFTAQNILILRIFYSMLMDLMMIMSHLLQLWDWIIVWFEKPPDNITWRKRGLRSRYGFYLPTFPCCPCKYWCS